MAPRSPSPLLATTVAIVLAACEPGSPNVFTAVQVDASTDAPPQVILDGGGGVPPPPDGVSLCPAGTCNYQSQSGCAPVDSCLPIPTGPDAVAPGCVLAGSVAGGGACAASGDCARGHLCAEGACRRLCCGGDWSACPEGEHCIREVHYPGRSGALETGAMLCFPVNTCDALEPYACPDPGTACQIVDATGATACAPAGSGGANEPCPCQGGFVCTAEVCRRLCKAVPGGGEPSCPPDEGVCVHFDRHPPGVGECTPM